tara:strand:- start:1380 stop:1895 length:516 start_codon:yes stop_codon:yes gene_type:complete
MKYILFFLLFITFSCTKQKSVLICGDHKCINRAEAKQYFEENLTIEIQIVSKNNKSSYDLVDLNLGSKEPNIKVYKNKNNKVIKKLSKKEIKAKKNELKKKMKESKKKAKIVKRNTVLNNKNNIKVKTAYNLKHSSTDICLKIEKCDIDSIANYLIKTNNDKGYPNIALKD